MCFIVCALLLWVSFRSCFDFYVALDPDCLYRCASVTVKTVLIVMGFIQMSCCMTVGGDDEEDDDDDNVAKLLLLL